MTRALLMLSYLFPPRGGAGVQRALKFAKYLPQFGWQPLIVAHGGSADNATRMRDRSLLGDLSADAVVRYTGGEEEGRWADARARLRQRLSPTDPMGWWVEPATRAAMDLLRHHDARAILVTMSPFTAAQAGIRLKRRTGLPLVLDLRDPWAMDETRIYPTRWHARRDWAAMAAAIVEADLLIMNTPEAARAVEEAFDIPDTTRVVCITNGFDGEDFVARRTDAHSQVRSTGFSLPPFAITKEQPKACTLNIVHTGMFHSEQAETWDELYAGRSLVSRLKHPRRPVNLWTRTPRYLLAAMERAIAEGTIPRGEIELILVGEISDADRRMVEQSSVRDIVRMIGYQTHEQSIAWLLSADVLFLPLHTPLDGGPALIVPGKTYEYLGSGRPILAMGAPGDMRHLVADTGSGVAIAGDDIAGAARALADLHRAKLAGRPLATQDHAAIVRFERRELTGILAAELDALADSSRLRTQHSALSTQH